MASRSQLYKYFKTGCKPTQAQFASLIDSTFNKDDDTLDATKIDGLNTAIASVVSQLINGDEEISVDTGTDVSAVWGDDAHTILTLTIDGTDYELNLAQSDGQGGGTTVTAEWDDEYHTAITLSIDGVDYQINCGGNGATFIPSVDVDGYLSWTNNGGLTNPETVCIKGAKGDKGDTGDTGATGATGDTGATGANGEDGQDAHVSLITTYDYTLSGTDYTAQASAPAEATNVVQHAYIKVWEGDTEPADSASNKTADLYASVNLANEVSSGISDLLD